MAKYLVTCNMSRDYEVEADCREDAEEDALQMFSDDFDITYADAEIVDFYSDCPCCKDGCCIFEDAETECDEYDECEYR